MVLFKSNWIMLHHYLSIDAKHITVSHFSYEPLFKGPYFFTKMQESNILYDNLLIDILSVWWHRKKYRNHSCESFCYAKGNFDKSAQLHVQSERLYFLLAFCARHYPWWSLWQKKHQKQLFYSSKPPFSVVEISNTVTVWRNARFDVILTSVTIFKQIFLRKLSCYESLIDIEVSKH